MHLILIWDTQLLSFSGIQNQNANEMMTAGTANLVLIFQLPVLGIVRVKGNAIVFHLCIEHSVKIFPAQRTLDDGTSMIVRVGILSALGMDRVAIPGHVQMEGVIKLFLQSDDTLPRPRPESEAHPQQYPGTLPCRRCRIAE